MKKILVLLFIICFFQVGYAQKDFRQGYIITKKGDRVNGFVKYRPGAKKFESCDFKKSKGDASVSYSPDQIKGYGIINDFYFESKKINDNENSSKNVFTEVLVEGNATLYNWKGNFFVKKNDTVFHKLDYTKKSIAVNGENLVKNSNRYIGSLTYLFSDCPNLKKKIEKTQYNKKSLTILFEKYNNCTAQPSVTYKANKKWLKMNFSLSASYFVTSLKFNPSQDDDRRNLKEAFSTPNSFVPSLDIHFSSPRINERVSFQTGIQYLKTTYKSFNNAQFGPFLARNDIIIDLEQLKIPFGIRYTFPTRTITPYGTLGISSTIHLDSNSSWKQEIEFDNIVEPSEDIDLNLDENQFGYWFAFGAKKTISRTIDSFLEFRYEYSRANVRKDISTLVPYNISTFQILIGLNI